MKLIINFYGNYLVTIFFIVSFISKVLLHFNLLTLTTTNQSSIITPSIIKYQTIIFIFIFIYFQINYFIYYLSEISNSFDIFSFLLFFILMKFINLIANLILYLVDLSFSWKSSKLNHDLIMFFWINFWKIIPLFIIYLFVKLIIQILIAFTFIIFYI